jgi:hypothetical protein
MTMLYNQYDLYHIFNYYNIMDECLYFLSLFV